MTARQWTPGHKMSREPLLPVEKQLIGWSLCIGVVALVILVTINHFVPVAV